MDMQELLIDASAFSELGLEPPEEHRAGSDGVKDGETAELRTGKDADPLSNIGDRGKESDTTGEELPPPLRGDPLGEGVKEGAESGGDTQAAGGDVQPHKSAGDAEREERRRQAELRRQREAAELERRIAEQVEQARAEERSKLEGLLRSVELLDPETGDLITTPERYEERREAIAGARLSRAVSEGTLTAEDLREVLAGTPEFRQIREASAELERQRQITAEAQKELARQRTDAMLTQELAAVRAFDPAINSIDDLGKTERYAELVDMTMKGLSISTAYKALYADKVMAERTAANAAVKAKAGTAHLTAAKKLGAVTTAEMPADVEDAFRQLLGDDFEYKSALKTYNDTI
jgi:hypothetical protein